jgi:hypothetical protein
MDGRGPVRVAVSLELRGAAPYCDCGTTYRVAGADVAASSFVRRPAIAGHMGSARDRNRSHVPWEDMASLVEQHFEPYVHAPSAPSRAQRFAAAGTGWEATAS